MLPASILTEFGDRIRSLRREADLSQEQFAEACGLDRTYISGIERGVRNVSLKNISLLADALEMSLHELFDGL